MCCGDIGLCLWCGILLECWCIMFLLRLLGLWVFYL